MDSLSDRKSNWQLYQDAKSRIDKFVQDHKIRSSEKRIYATCDLLAILEYIIQENEDMRNMNGVYKTECYFYREEQDMNARIRYCALPESIGEKMNARCQGCSHIVSKTFIDDYARSLASGENITK